MSLLFRILYAAHANGSHHKLALDGLAKLTGPDAEGWRRLFLAHAEDYLTASKLPDNEFKDFKNHVLHVRDGYWGGAADKTEEWYGKLVFELRARNWPEVVRAAGILSHYFTDPVHPFHTGQSEAENNVHRAVEWSISRSYDALADIARRDFSHISPEPGDGPHWLRAFVASGADASNRHYEALMAHYDLDRGVADPPEGLDASGRRIVAELIAYASAGYARVLERAIDEAAVEPPNVELTVATVMAALKIPLKFVLKKMADAEDRRAVEAMYHELKATGRVESTLGEAERVVRALHAREVAPAQEAARQAARISMIASGFVPAVVARAAVVTPPAAEPYAAPPPVTSPAAGAVTVPAIGPAAVPVPIADVPAPPTETIPQTAEEAPAASVVAPAETPADLLLQGLTEEAAIPTAGRPRTAYLNAADDVEKAPSIGPKTAQRLAAIGIHTVRDLIEADAADVATRLASRAIRAATVRAWQQQARLVMEIAGLRGTHAQLLTGAGYLTRSAVAAADPGELCAALLTFSMTSDGQRILRDQGPPPVERVSAWVEAARSAA